MTNSRQSQSPAAFILPPRHQFGMAIPSVSSKHQRASSIVRQTLGRDTSQKNTKPGAILFHCVLLGILALGTTACVNANELGNDELAMAEDENTAEARGALTHGCKLGVDCHLDGSGIVTNLVAGTAATYRIKMTGYRRMDIFANVCNPSGWWLHVADSPTNDGWGGDGASTDHDAEAHMNGTTFSYFSAWDVARGEAGTRAIAQYAYPGGCRTVRMTAFHPSSSPASTFRYFSDNANSLPSVEVASLHGLKIGYTACASATATTRAIECDWENSSLTDKDYWYIGVNRTVGDGSRSGSGVSSVCIVLDSNINANPSSCLGSAPVAYCGDGLCNNGETSTSCAEDCLSACPARTGDPTFDAVYVDPCIAAL
ncbi:MAG TPA: hypothetical protein PK156_25715 [Polyangium sp.]|nr:hypothetical protein [Polyangium sp.]